METEYALGVVGDSGHARGVAVDVLHEAARNIYYDRAIGKHRLVSAGA